MEEIVFYLSRLGYILFGIAYIVGFGLYINYKENQEDAELDVD